MFLMRFRDQLNRLYRDERKRRVQRVQNSGRQDCIHTWSFGNMMPGCHIAQGVSVTSFIQSARKTAQRLQHASLLNNVAHNFLVTLLPFRTQLSDCAHFALQVGQHRRV